MPNRVTTSILITVTIAGSIMLFAGGPDYYSARSVRAVWDLGHIILFGSLTWLLLRHLNWLKNISHIKQFVFILLLTLVLGIITELAQFDVNRSPEIPDLLRDLLGSWAVLVFLPRNNTLSHNVPGKGIKGLTLVLLLLALWPLGRALADEWIAKKQFPLLSGFETPFETDRWEATAFKERSEERSVQGQYALKCLLTREKYSGFALKYFPGDWRGFQYLNFRIFSEADTQIDLHCRIHDEQHIKNGQPYHDRFNTILSLKPGWNNYQISLNKVENMPQQRKMNMDRVRSLAFFVLDLKKPTYVFIDDVYLN